MTGWILEKCEDAWINYFSNSPLTTTTVSYLHGVSITEKTGPLLIAVATSADEVEYGSGVYSVDLLLSLRVPLNGNTTLTTRNPLVEEFLKKVFNSTTIITDLQNSTNNLGVIDIVWQGHGNDFADNAIICNVALKMIVLITE